MTFWVLNQNEPFAPNNNFFWISHQYNFHALLAPCTIRPIMRMDHFWVQHGPLTPKKYLFGKIMNIIFIYLLTNFIVPNFNFFLQYTQSYEVRMCHFSTQNGPICPEQNTSENLLINLVPIIHAYLHSKN